MNELHKFTENQLQLLAAYTMLERITLSMNSIRIQTQDMKDKEKAFEYVKEMMELYSLVKTQKEFYAMKEHVLKEENEKRT